MQITCGIYLYSVRTGKILACHATRSPWNNWSIPKGLKDADEGSFEAAKRELKEETGIDLSHENVLSVITLDPVKYQKQNKILEGFLVICDGDLEERNLHCATLVNNKYPEVDKYKWISPETEGHLLHESQQKNLSRIIDLVASGRDEDHK